MAGVDELPQRGRVILDSGGVLALANGSGNARAALERGRLAGDGVVIPVPVVAQIHRGGRSHARLDRVFKAVDAIVLTTVEIARAAGDLQAAACTDDPVDAIVVAEALASIPAIIITTDGGDLRRLLDTDPDAARVVIIEV